MRKNSILSIVLTFCLSAFIVGTTFSQTFEILSPPACAGVYEIGLPAFGPDYSVESGDVDVCGNADTGSLPTLESDLIVTLTSSDTNTSYTCNEQLPITNDVSGKIAMVDRGDCFFVDKTQNCQDAGAIMVIICNRDDEVIPMGGGNENLVIPTVMLKLSDCTKLKAQLDSGESISGRYAQSSSASGIAGPQPGDIVTNPNPPTNIVWMEDFADGMDGWTSVGISSDYDEQPIDELAWTHQATWKEQDALGIKTLGAVCNGAAIFDAEFFGGIYGGTGGDFMICEFISPTIDLTGRGLMQLSLTQFNLPLNGNVFFSYSSDNGATWSEETLITTNNVANDFDNPTTEFMSFPLFDLEPTAECKIKFVADMDYYYIYIDDIIISELTGTNATISGTSYWPTSYAVPLDHACADPFQFSVAVSNTGAEAISAVNMEVTVTNENTGQVAYTGGDSYFLLGVGETQVLVDSTGWVPTAVGTYRIEHSVNVPNQSENRLDDNVSEVQYFEITDDKFTTHSGSTGVPSFNSSYQWDEYGVGVVYATCAEVDEVLAYGVQAYIDSDDPITTMEGNYITVDIIRFVDGFDGVVNFDPTNIDLFGNPQIEIVHEIIYEFTADDQPGIINIPFLDGGELFPLTPGEVYLIYIHFDSFQFGNAEVPNSGLGIGFYQEDFNANYDWLRTVTDGTWFTGGYAGGGNPYISLCLNGPGEIVPVELSQFSATANAADITLDWTTLSEVNNEGFEVERSIDGKEFNKISFVAADGANSNRKVDYNYVDRNVVDNVTYYYRLKQVDIDGRFEYSDIVNATIVNKTTTTVSSFYPNPVRLSDISQLTITSENDSDNSSYSIVNQSGVRVATNRIQLTKGINTIEVDKDGLASGVYMVQFTIENKTYTKKLVIVD